LTIEHVFAIKFFTGAQIHERILGVRGPNCTKLATDTEPSSVLTKFVTYFRYLAAFSNASRSESSDVEKNDKFLTFDPCKISGGVGEISGSLIVSSLTTEPRKYI